MYTLTKRTRIKSTLSGLGAAMASLMLSYAFGGLPSEPIATGPALVPGSAVVILDAQHELDAKAEQGQAQRRHMKRVLATPYLSVGRLLPRRGS